MKILPLSLCLFASACSGPRGASGPPAPQPPPDAPPASPATMAMASSQPTQVLPGTPAPAPLDSTQIQRARVESLLNGYEYSPRPETIRALGPGTFEILHSIYADPSELTSTRARALAALGDLEDARAVATLKGVLETKDSSPLFTRTALFALSHAQGSAAVPTVAALLQDPDPTVRIAAAEALGQIGGPGARAALQKQLDAEVKPEVRSRIAP